ncbi:MAG: hypothetical protein HKN06_00315 [Gammaproteobacteria bacterium]|nr:hypothetical protein [Gammaproteobacteria bacterium]
MTFSPSPAPTVDGRLINLLAWVEDDQGEQARAGEAYLTGCIEELDVDCDGVRAAAIIVSSFPNRHSVVVGGQFNETHGQYSVVSGGSGDSATGSHDWVAGNGGFQDY